jgi:hypothetical protein
VDITVPRQATDISGITNGKSNKVGLASTGINDYFSQV